MFRYLYFYRNFNYFFVNYIFKLLFCLQYYHWIMPIKLLFINNSTICLQEQRISRSGKCFSEEPFSVSLEAVGEDVIYLYFFLNISFLARDFISRSLTTSNCTWWTWQSSCWRQRSRTLSMDYWRNCWQVWTSRNDRFYWRCERLGNTQKRRMVSCPP